MLSMGQENSKINVTGSVPPFPLCSTSFVLNSLLKEILFLLNFLHRCFFNGSTKYSWLSSPHQISDRRIREITPNETSKNGTSILGDHVVEFVFSATL